jgi:hypothetical protein
MGDNGSTAGGLLGLVLLGLPSSPNKPIPSCPYHWLGLLAHIPTSGCASCCYFFPLFDLRCFFCRYRSQHGTQ